MLRPPGSAEAAGLAATEADKHLLADISGQLLTRLAAAHPAGLSPESSAYAGLAARFGGAELLSAQAELTRLRLIAARAGRLVITPEGLAEVERRRTAGGSLPPSTRPSTAQTSGSGLAGRFFRILPGVAMLAAVGAIVVTAGQAFLGRDRPAASPTAPAAAVQAASPTAPAAAAQAASAPAPAAAVQAASAPAPAAAVQGASAPAPAAAVQGASAPGAQQFADTGASSGGSGFAAPSSPSAAAASQLVGRAGGSSVAPPATAAASERASSVPAGSAGLGAELAAGSQPALSAAAAASSSALATPPAAATPDSSSPSAPSSPPAATLSSAWISAGRARMRGRIARISPADDYWFLIERATAGGYFRQGPVVPESDGSFVFDLVLLPGSSGPYSVTLAAVPHDLSAAWLAEYFRIGTWLPVIDLQPASGVSFLDRVRL